MKKPDILKAKNLPSLYLERMRSSSLWNIADRFFTYTRRFFFITKLLRVAAAVITFIQTSAMLLAYATIFLTLIPVILVVIAAGSAAGWFCETRIVRKYPPPNEGEIFVLFPPDRELLEKVREKSDSNRRPARRTRSDSNTSEFGDSSEPDIDDYDKEPSDSEESNSTGTNDSFRDGLARELLESGAVYVIDHEPGYLFKGGKRGFYPAKDCGGVVYISRSLFLKMRRKFFDKTPERMKYLF